MLAVGRDLADMAFSVVNKSGDAQNSSPDAGGSLQSQVRELVAIQPMQTIIRRMKACSRHVPDNFDEGFDRGMLPTIRHLCLFASRFRGGLSLFMGIRWWLERAFGKRVKLV
jgi:hypothetical protein